MVPAEYAAKGLDFDWWREQLELFVRVQLQSGGNENTIVKQ